MHHKTIAPILAAFFLTTGSQSVAQECEKTFDSTYDLIQEAIFENKGCTAAFCHGAAADSAAGGLDLRAGQSYDALIEQPAQSVAEGTVAGLKRVVPGQKDQSLLFLNLAAATLPDQWRAPRRPMPVGGALSTDELEAVREWIEQGAPRQGTVPGTGELLDACLPPPKPIQIEPLPEPDPNVGRQIRMPKWNLPPESEDEVCFASYFDISQEIPAKYLSADGERFRFKRTQIRQDPLSHHLIVTYYTGSQPFDDPSWGEFKCRGGDKEGQACEPTDLDFCGAGLCGSEPKRSIACINFGPPDSRSQRGVNFPGAQEASFEQNYPDGVFGELPTKGLLIWNSHAFNLTEEEGKLEAWINFEFAEPEEQISRVRGIFNTEAIFGMNVPAFEAEEICNHHVLPANARLFELNSHTHQRGKRFRIFDGRYACNGGSADGRACSPIPESSVEVPDACDGAPCEMLVPPSQGDCNGNGKVDIGDLITCVNIALDRADVDECRTGDRDSDGQVRINEIIGAVRAALAGSDVSGEEPALLYTNLVYNDPTVVNFAPAREYPDSDASAAARTLTYCSLFDNGYSDPGEVKRKSTSPPTPFGAIAPGGPCRTATACTEGNVGASCNGDSDDADASCDSSPGAGDGVCDACTLLGGVTTEDEMFIIMGGFYIEGS